VTVAASQMVIRSLMIRSMRISPSGTVLEELADGPHPAVAEVVVVVRLPWPCSAKSVRTMETKSWLSTPPFLSGPLPAFVLGDAQVLSSLKGDLAQVEAAGLKKSELTGCGRSHRGRMPGRILR